MALYTKKEFSAMCGVAEKNLYVYISRGNVVVKRNMIDGENEKNKLFLQKRSAKLDSVVPNTPVKVLEKADYQKNEDEEIDTEFLTEEKDKVMAEVKGKTKNRRNLRYDELAREKLLTSIEKTEVETRLALLKEEKLKGANIPTDMVRTLAGQMGRSYVTKFKDGCEKLIIEISKRKALTPEESASLRGVLIKIINESIDVALIDMQNGINIVQEQYMLSRGVGEHG
jgi:hypothetical protein